VRVANGGEKTHGILGTRPPSHFLGLSDGFHSTPAQLTIERHSTPIAGVNWFIKRFGHYGIIWSVQELDLTVANVKSL
jgi:hypothetical protein